MSIINTDNCLINELEKINLLDSNWKIEVWDAINDLYYVLQKHNLKIYKLQIAPKNTPIKNNFYHE